ncbi:MAG: stage II sporulation protein M [Chitinophagaceae bacterium]
MASSAVEPDFARAILGNAYVDMTLENIEKGDPFGVYKSGDSFTMFLLIAWNNIRVSLLLFGMGIGYGVGTFYFLFRNALMVGVFEYLFYRNHLGGDFFLVVFIHGTLELSALVIAGASGFMIARALIFPGTYTRLAALRRSSLDAVKVSLSQVPVLLIAAFFESYVTRHTEMPVCLSIMILILSLLLVAGYFLYYPHRVFQKTQSRLLEQAA